MLICDLRDEFIRECVASPALRKQYESIKTAEDLEKFPDRWKPVLIQLQMFGPIALLRPDSGQIEGKPQGWNFGTEERPDIRYAYDDWPSEYKLYWEQRPATPQADFLYSNAKITAIIGGNGVAKTTSLLAVLIAGCHGIRPWLTPDDENFVFRYPDGRPMEPPIQVAYLTDDFAKILKVAYRQKLFRPGGWAPGNGKVPHPRDESVKINQALLLGGDWNKATKKSSTGMPAELSFANGSSVSFYSYAQDIEAWEGPEQHMVCYDEPPIREAWVATQRGLRTSGGPTYLALTPISQAWLQSSVVDAAATNAAIKVVVTDSFSNYRNQDPAWVYERWDDLHPTEIRSRIFGRYASTEGAVFKEFDTHDGAGYVVTSREIPYDWPVVMGLDPHPNKRGRVTWLLVRPDDGVEVIHTKVLEGIGAEEQVAEIQQLEASFPWNNRVVVRVMDPHIAVQTLSLYGDSETSTVLDLFESKSPESWIWEIPEARGPGSIAIGHSIMHDMMKPKYNRLTMKTEPRFQIWKDGDEGGLINALTRYSYKTQRAGSKEAETVTNKLQDDEHKDMVDPVRYPITWGLSYVELQAVTSARAEQEYRPVIAVSKAG